MLWGCGGGGPTTALMPKEPEEDGPLPQLSPVEEHPLICTLRVDTLGTLRLVFRDISADKEF